MMARYDRFHAEYESEGKRGEIEGGWTGYPEDWNSLSKEDKNRWWRETCTNWGMPRGAEILRIWLAG